MASPAVIVNTETLGRTELDDSEQSVAGIFKKDRGDDRVGGGVAVTIKEFIATVLHPLPKINSCYILAYGVTPLILLPSQNLRGHLFTLTKPRFLTSTRQWSVAVSDK